MYTPNRSELPIVEIPLREHERIDAVGRLLFERGVYVTLAAYPLVPKAEVGFRVQLTAANTDAEVDVLIGALSELAALGELQCRGRRIGPASALARGGMKLGIRAGHSVQPRLRRCGRRTSPFGVVGHVPVSAGAHR